MSAPIDLARVRRLFAHPARVQPSDFLRREIGARMHERLSLVKIVPQRVLDAGCGAGADLGLLQNRFPAAHLLALDGAPAMLGAAAAAGATRGALNNLIAKWLPGKAGLDLLCGNFAELPLAPNSVDLIWSNLALHWHPQPDRAFAEWRRVLQVDGLLMFSCFGPDTLRQVRAAFEGVDDAAHGLPFVDMHDLGDMLLAAGFAAPVMDMETITLTYSTAQALLADARAWGGNPLATRRRGLLGRRDWRRVQDKLEQGRRPDGTLGLTFEVIYGHAFKPKPRVTASGEAIIHFDLQRPPK